MRPNPQKTADLVTFTEEILNGKIHFLCSAWENCVTVGVVNIRCCYYQKQGFNNDECEETKFINVYQLFPVSLYR